MQVNDMDAATLRRLAGLHPEGAKVLSVYVNLDPSEFAVPASRSTEINSVLDEAERKIADLELDRNARLALREDLDRARRFLSDGGANTKGAHALAVFAAGPAGLFEAARLPRPVDAGAAVRDTPWVEPVLRLARRERICAALVNRRNARIFAGTPERLEELESVIDDVHGWHDQGGWSQSRFQRGIEKEIADHLRRTAGVMFARFRRSPCDLVFIGGPEDVVPSFEEALHPYMRERLAGRFDVDVENTNVDAVAAALAPLLERREIERERAALERLKAGLGAGSRAAAGFEDVLEAVSERRIATLLYAEGRSAPGVACPKCGWLGIEGETCPADGTPLLREDDIVERAVEAVVLQSAEALPVRHHPDLGPHGGIAAVLRF